MVRNIIISEANGIWKRNISWEWMISEYSHVSRMIGALTLTKAKRIRKALRRV